jgi:hypothetical protein
MDRHFLLFGDVLSCSRSNVTLQATAQKPPAKADVAEPVSPQPPVEGHHAEGATDASANVSQEPALAIFQERIQGTPPCPGAPPPSA